MDFAKAKDMIALYADFVKKFPENTKAEDYLFKAGEVSMGAMQSNVAIKYFEQYYEKYPKADKAPYSLFMQGFIYETQVNNTEKAKWCYEKFISDFPAHKLAEDAKYSIANLGKSEEELIREFEAKLKVDSATAGK
jgi:TolA-binding protein